jgi:hypothetical protein
VSAIRESEAGRRTAGLSPWPRFRLPSLVCPPDRCSISRDSSTYSIGRLLGSPWCRLRPRCASAISRLRRLLEPRQPLRGGSREIRFQELSSSPFPGGIPAITRLGTFIHLRTSRSLAVSPRVVRCRPGPWAVVPSASGGSSPGSTRPSRSCHEARTGRSAPRSSKGRGSSHCRDSAEPTAPLHSRGHPGPSP